MQAETKPIPSANPSTKAGSTEELHFSSNDENDVFDWQSTRDHLHPIGPTPSKPVVVVPILSPANSAIADRPIPDSPARMKGKAPAGRIIARHAPSSPDEEEQMQRPAKRQRRYHIITADSDDDSSNAIPVSQPEKSADPSLSLLVFNYFVSANSLSHPMYFCPACIEDNASLEFGGAFI
ncbi:hypothetical protein V6N13_135458 [Hibiscus sabdariffa]|uniref:Uncharacterized protein n=1 Tax=Hibiscus sabdariffa TaxID=183260 RepID=A0ABR2R6W5_9ROSI